MVCGYARSCVGAGADWQPIYGRYRARKYNDRPYIGLAIAVVPLLSEWTQRLGQTVVITIAGAVFGLYSVIAIEYTAQWQNSITLWQRSLLVTDPGYQYLASTASRDQPAVFHVQRRLWLPHINIAHAYFERGFYSEAVQHFDIATRLDAEQPKGFADMAVALMALERWEEADEAISVALQLAPENPLYLHRQNKIKSRARVDTLDQTPTG